MIITGDNKERFEEWYEKKRISPTLENEHGDEYSGFIAIKGFYELPLSMQWGVFLEYYLSIGIPIHTSETIWSIGGHGKIGIIVGESSFETLQKGTLKKVDKVANEKLNKDD